MAHGLVLVHFSMQDPTTGTSGCIGPGFVMIRWQSA
jgi:hypothetical protein